MATAKKRTRCSRRRTKVDLVGLGEQLKACKGELMGETD